MKVGSWGVIGYRVKDPADLRIRAIRHGVPDHTSGLADACGIAHNTMRKVMGGRTVSAEIAAAVFAVLGEPKDKDPSALFEPVPLPPLRRR